MRIGLTLVVLAGAGLPLTGCGGGSSSSGVAHLATSTPASGAGAVSQGPASPEGDALAFAECMRSSGVPNFPDPAAGGGFLFNRSAGVDPSSPAFQTAQAKCKKFLPPGPGSGPPPSAQTLAHWLKIAQCMRRHGVSDFPDPRTRAPSHPAAVLGRGGGVISDIEGVIFVFPGTLEEQLPQFTRAAAACQFPLHNH